MLGFRFVEIKYYSTYPSYEERKTRMDEVEKEFGQRPSFYVREATHPDSRAKYSDNYTPDAQWVRIISLV